MIEIKYLYLLYSRLRFKIGIATILKARVVQIDKTTQGQQRLVFAVILPWNARKVEASLHRRYQKHHAPFKAGSGRTEYFRAGFWVLECAVLMIAVSLFQWVLIWGGLLAILFVVIR